MMARDYNKELAALQQKMKVVRKDKADHDRILDQRVGHAVRTLFPDMPTNPDEVKDYFSALRRESNPNVDTEDHMAHSESMAFAR